jgi:adenylate cyclase
LGARDSLICRLRYEGRTRDEDRVFDLGDRARILGRAPDCDLVLNHESVSRAHARFTRDGDSWRISDLGSKNGVRVNTYRIDEQKLQDGDRIDLGSTRLYVEIGPAPAPDVGARVVFSEREEPGLHTEILEMSGLTSLLSPAGPEPWAAPADSHAGLVSGNLAQIGEEVTKDAGDPLRLVSLAAEALISCDSLDETLDRIMDLVFETLPVERGVICLHDYETGETTPTIMRTLDGVPDDIKISSNIANHVIKKKQALLVRDTLLDERFGSAESVIMLEIYSAMCAPLYRDGRVAGFIYVDRQSRSEPFDTPHLHALSALAMLSAVAVEQASLRDSIRHEQSLRARLARYSSPAVVDRILETAPGSDEGAMVTDAAEVSVLFADLKGFTGMAETMPSADVIHVLNRVFERLTEAVFALDGTLDKFRGDGMMVFFGAPLPMPDHAERAVEAALRMQESLGNLNDHTQSLRDLRVRIGINSGSVVVGDIGSPQRKDYTVIGDVVNTASRIESYVAEPGQVVIGHSTWELVHGKFDCKPLDEVLVKGKRRAIRPYLVVGRR